MLVEPEELAVGSEILHQAKAGHRRGGPGDPAEQALDVGERRNPLHGYQEQRRRKPAIGRARRASLRASARAGSTSRSAARPRMLIHSGSRLRTPGERRASQLFGKRHRAARRPAARPPAAAIGPTCAAIVPAARASAGRSRPRRRAWPRPPAGTGRSPAGRPCRTAARTPRRPGRSRRTRTSSCSRGSLAAGTTRSMVMLMGHDRQAVRVPAPFVGRRRSSKGRSLPCPAPLLPPLRPAP